MKNTLFHFIIIVCGLILGLTLSVPANAQPADRIRVEVSLMDDYGFLLADYQTDYFSIEKNRFVYHEPPVLEGYTFATVNVLKLETEEGYSYRVNYFYTQDELTPASLPEPVPMEEIPYKRVQLERRPVWVSFIDESSKELADSRIQTWDFFWETYVIPEPLALKGYGFTLLKTGTKKYQGEQMPHFAYVYSREDTANPVPSLIFEHLIESKSLRTIRRETISKPTTSPESMPPTKPGTSPQSQAQTSPATKPAATGPATKPAATGQPETQTTPGTARPVTRPDVSSTSAGAGSQPELPSDQAGSGVRAGQPVLVIGSLIVAGSGLIYLYFKNKKFK